MSGDFFSHNDQQPPLPCKASQAMDEIKEDRWIDTNYILEIESMIVNARYRTGSPMQD
jgi:hypothetical protein|tara:strand:- start:119 stop:292 length:174 start_codon:yes stop_codon:yes gene_type:complete